MILTVLAFIFGTIFILKGADLLVDASSNIARRFHLSEFLIGVTIVGIGTSMPELSVSTVSAIQGNSDITIGNVTGSNICNILLILGVTSLIAPVTYSRDNIRKDIPLGIATSAILVLCSVFGRSADSISFLEGCLLLICFALYLFWMFKQGPSDNVESEESKGKLYKDIILIVVGLAGLVIGGKMFVNSATTIAKLLGVSDAVIAVTLVAFGTSLPELATSAVAAAKGKGQLALGNVIGSNIANILLIVGIGAVICPINITGTVSYISILATLAASVMLFIPLLTNRKRRAIGRFEGVCFLLAYVGYIYATIVL